MDTKGGVVAGLERVGCHAPYHSAAAAVIIHPYTGFVLTQRRAEEVKAIY